MNRALFAIFALVIAQQPPPALRPRIQVDLYANTIAYYINVTKE